MGRKKCLGKKYLHPHPLPSQLPPDSHITCWRVLRGCVLTFARHSWAPELRQSVARQKTSFASAVVTIQSVGAGCVGWARGGIQTLIHIWTVQKEEVRLELQGELQGEGSMRA